MIHVVSTGAGGGGEADAGPVEGSVSTASEERCGCVTSEGGLRGSLPVGLVAGSVLDEDMMGAVVEDEGGAVPVCTTLRRLHIVTSHDIT